MLTFLLDGVYNTYNWLIKKLRSIALDFIALFNKEYADSKRIRYIIKDHLVKKDLINIEPELEIKYELKRDLINIEPKFKIKYDPYITKIDSSKMFKVMEQEHRSIENLKNVIQVRIEDLVGRGFSYSYGSGRDPVFYAMNQAHEIKGITKDNTDLVLLLWLMYVHVPIDEHGELLKDLVRNHSGNRAEMIEKLYLLQEEGKLSINNRESLGWIIKISPLIEKEYISNGKFPVMQMVSSGNIDDLEKRLKKDIEGRVKELTGIDIQYSPESSLKNLSIHAVIESYGLLNR
ncbi:hypothetical protein [Wolbachia endosymbiont (group B) of Hofmannophila pseudospretella]|uniref:hypothetical protein n=1 Tax=Wolbachia endosymbiont (group B) of Hofmannophila pseudospretella TaxID=3066177 RepID=UPI0033405F81